MRFRLPEARLRRRRFAATRLRTYNGVDQIGVWALADALRSTMADAALSIGGWMRFPGNTGRVLSLVHPGASAANSLHLKMDTATNRLVVLAYNGTPAIVGTLNHTGIAPLADAVTWRFFCLIEVAGYLALWIDASKQSTTYTPPDNAPPTRLAIGGIGYDTPAAFAQQDVAQIWAVRRDLSNDEVAALRAVGGPHDMRRATGAYKPIPGDLVFDDWCGDGGDTPAYGINRGLLRGRTVYDNTTASDIIVGGP